MKQHSLPPTEGQASTAAPLPQTFASAPQITDTLAALTKATAHTKPHAPHAVCRLCWNTYSALPRPERLRRAKHCTASDREPGETEREEGDDE